MRHFYTKTVLILFFLLSGSFVQSATIELKTGEMIEGKILSQSLGSFKVKTPLKEVQTYYLYEIKSIDGKKPIMDDPFTVLVDPKNIEPPPNKKFYIQENDLFSMIIPSDYNWYELPGQVMITGEQNDPMILINYFLQVGKDLSFEKKQEYLQAEIDHREHVLKSQVAGNKYKQSKKQFNAIEAYHLEYYTEKKGKRYYCSYSAFFQDDTIYTLSVETSKRGGRKDLYEIFKTIDFFVPTLDEFIRKGEIALKFKQYDQAQNIFFKALKIDPFDVEANYLVGLTYLKKAEQSSFDAANCMQAEKYFLKALQGHEQHLKTIKALGILYTAMKQPDKANFYFENFLDMSEKEPEVILKLAMNYESLNQTERAIPFFEQYLKFAPDNAKIYLHLAMGYGEILETKKALEYIKWGKALLDKKTDKDLIQTFDKTKIQILKEARRSKKKRNPGISLIYYILMGGFAFLFFKGLLLIVENVSEKGDKYIR